MTLPLPPGFGVRLGAGVRRCDGGRVLLGGSAGSVLLLTPPAAHEVDGWPAVPSGATGRAVARLLLDRGYADPWWPDPAGADAAVSDVTVVVPIKDRADLLDDLLAALAGSAPALPVVVVDDGSARPEALAAVAARHGARLVRHPVNQGPAAARNTGLREVGTPYVAFVDSDVRPAPGWLAVLRRHLDDPAVALVAPRVLGPEAREGDSWVERYEQARSSLDLGPAPASVRIHGRVAYVPSACLLARVADLGDGFDERMRSGEDVDLVWRLLEQGRSVRYEPAATVRHRHRVDPADWLGRKAFYGESAADLAARHPGAVSPMVLSPWTAVLAVAVLAQRRWSLPVALVSVGVATAVTARRLGRTEHPVRTAATLTAEGAVASLWQTAAALTRHHWPLAVTAALVSRRARRALLVAAVADGLADHRRTRPRLDPARYVVARRLDDLAYGAGVWRGAIRARSMAALLPTLSSKARSGREQRGGLRRTSDSSRPQG